MTTEALPSRVQSNPSDTPEAEYYRNEPTFSHLGRNALNMIEVGSPNSDHEQAYMDFFGRKRADILKLPSNEIGLNIARIHEYREEMGAPKKPLLFLCPSDYEAALSINRSSNVGESEQNRRMEDSSGGMYLQEFDLIVVRRDPKLEEINGSIYTEGIAIHEIAHSSATINPVTLEQQVTKKKLFGRKSQVTVNGDRTRSGFIVKKINGDTRVIKGMFLEEAYADYERGQYLLRQGLDANDFGNPGKDAQPLREIVPDQYWYKDRSGNITAPLRSTLPAASLGLLIAHDPVILTALRQSRSSADGLRDVARRINTVMPGLYSRMRDTDIDINGLENSIKTYLAVSDQLQTTKA